MQVIGLAKEYLYSIDIAAELKRIIDFNDEIYGKDRRKWPSEEYGSRRYYNNGGESSRRTERSLGQNGEIQFKIDQMSFFITPHGVVYGFVDKDGDIYINETIVYLGTG